jgi:hypothetical protein
LCLSPSNFHRLVREIIQKVVQEHEDTFDTMVRPRTRTRQPPRLDPRTINVEQDAVTALQYATEHILVMMFDMM